MQRRRCPEGELYQGRVREDITIGRSDYIECYFISATRASSKGLRIKFSLGSQRRGIMVDHLLIIFSTEALITGKVVARDFLDEQNATMVFSAFVNCQLSEYAFEKSSVWPLFRRDRHLEDLVEL